MSKIIGRNKQVEQLEKLLNSDKSELVAIYGRRRVGKTFLIRETYKKHIIFEVSGIPSGSYKDQLKNFYNEICNRKKAFLKKDIPKNWFEAFNLLSDYIESKRGDEKKVLFIDEFPWMYTHKSKFVQMFSHFWNSYCSKRTDLVVVKNLSD